MVRQRVERILHMALQHRVAGPELILFHSSKHVQLACYVRFGSKADIRLMSSFSRKDGHYLLPLILPHAADLGRIVHV